MNDSVGNHGRSRPPEWKRNRRGGQTGASDLKLSRPGPGPSIVDDLTVADTCWTSSSRGYARRLGRRSSSAPTLAPGPTTKPLFIATPLDAVVQGGGQLCGRRASVPWGGDILGRPARLVPRDRLRRRRHGSEAMSDLARRILCASPCMACKLDASALSGSSRSGCSGPDLRR